MSDHALQETELREVFNLSLASSGEKDRIRSLWFALAEHQDGKLGTTPPKFSALLKKFRVDSAAGALCTHGYFWTDENNNYWRAHGKRRSAEIGRGEVANTIQVWVLDERSAAIENDLLVQIEKLPLDGRFRRQALLTIRLGQREFRNRLLDAYGCKCWVSDCAVERVLQAAHIEPHNGSNNMTGNGILLRADLHNLLDADLLWIEPRAEGYYVRLSPALRGSYGEYKDRLLLPPKVSPSDCPDAERLLRTRPDWHPL
jgi:HNH endonuclease